MPALIRFVVAIVLIAAAVFLAQYADQQGWLSSEGKPDVASVNAFDVAITNNETAEVLGFAFLKMADQIGEDKKAMNKVSHVESMIREYFGPRFSAEKLEGLDAANWPVAFANVMNELNGNDKELMTDERRVESSALVRRIGREILESSKQ